MTGFLPKKGNYHDLLSYRKAVIIYDATFRFCERFLEKHDRTIDQMVQAARSGKQNIVEGSMAGVASAETELKLTNVARASMEELLEDYLDFLRVRNLKLWPKDSREAQYVRKQEKTKESYETYREFLETRAAEVCANIIICLVHQCNYLLNQQIRKLERDFVKQGGIREKMYTARKTYRKNPGEDKGEL
ncbi:MAG: four helix bundle suffix domain-containing protein [Candidatus Cloacimonetes bacterium]|nr:four helix bundle suffix domain-containing protein [Candidatus Cloacimonadota bacterium]